MGSGSVAFSRWCLTPFGQALPPHLTFTPLHRPSADLHLCTVIATHRPPYSVLRNQLMPRPYLLYVCRCLRISPLHLCTGLRPICTFALSSQLTVLRTLYSVINSCHDPTFCMCAAASASHLYTFAPASGRFAPLHLPAPSQPYSSQPVPSRAQLAPLQLSPRFLPSQANCEYVRP